MNVSSAAALQLHLTFRVELFFAFGVTTAISRRAETETTSATCHRYSTEQMSPNYIAGNNNKQRSATRQGAGTTLTRPNHSRAILHLVTCSIRARKMLGGCLWQWRVISYGSARLGLACLPSSYANSVLPFIKPAHKLFYNACICQWRGRNTPTAATIESGEWRAERTESWAQNNRPQSISRLNFPQFNAFLIAHSERRFK